MAGRGSNGIAPRSGPPPDVLTIAGADIDLVATNTTIDSLTSFDRGGAPSLGFSRLTGTPGALPDPWHLRPCTLSMRSTIVFAGTVTGYTDRYLADLGWLREYRAVGLGYNANYIPVTDSQSLTDTSTWNLPGDDVNMVPARAGQSVGQIVGAILTMVQNANGLAAAGLGNYTTAPPYTSPPTLPSATANDLAALTFIPVGAVRVAGERILAALEGFVRSWHPNHFLHVQPDGTIRFLDPRTFPVTIVTLNDPSDHRWDMPELTRDASDNYSQVMVRGNTLCRGLTLQDKPWPGSTAADGGLSEDFAHDGMTNAAAKSAWVPTDWSQPNGGLGPAMETGTCTATDTTHLTLATRNSYAANQLAQGAGELLGWVNLSSDSLLSTVDQYWLARVIANAASTGSAGAYSTAITIDAPTPDTTYGSYQLFGLAAGANVVGRRYKVTNAAIAHAMQLVAPYPLAMAYANGSSAEMTSTPMGLIQFSPTGGTSPPYAVSSDGVTIDPQGGLIYFDTPVQVIAGGLQTPVRWPAIVQAFLIVGVGTMAAYAPSSTGHAGTLYTVEGVARTKTITVLDWRDQSNQSNMQTYANEVLDSVKDVVVEGTLPYQGLPDISHLAPGKAVSIAGADFVTGWESIALPVVACEVNFQNGPTGTSYHTTLRLSNRRTPYDASNFLRPNMTMAMIAGGLSGPFGAAYAPSRAESASLQQQARDLTASSRRPAAGFTGRTIAASDVVPGGLESAAAGMAGGLYGAGVEMAGAFGVDLGAPGGMAGDLGDMGPEGRLPKAGRLPFERPGFERVAEGERPGFERLPAAERAGEAERREGIRRRPEGPD